MLLIKEVPLLQTSEALKDHIKTSIEKSENFLLLVVKGIGTQGMSIIYTIEYKGKCIQQYVF